MNQFFFFLLFFITVNICYSQSEDNRQESDNKNQPVKKISQKASDPEEEHLNNFIYFQGSKGTASNEIDRGPINSYKLGFLNSINPYIDIGLGFTHANLFLQSRTKDYSAALSVALARQTNSYSSDNLGGSVLLLLSVFDSSYKDRYAYGLLSADINFHPNLSKSIDPFLGLSALAGSCNSSFTCTVGGYELRGGLQINLSDVFLFVQISNQNLFLRNTNLGLVNINNALPSFGFGIRY